ncbi:MAG: zinc ribbon domain-containing protein [Candidatus Thorarchaeota archaeon]
MTKRWNIVALILVLISILSLVLFLAFDFPFLFIFLFLPFTFGLRKSSRTTYSSLYCKFCGTELPKDSSFCPKCGSIIDY